MTTYKTPYLARMSDNTIKEGNIYYSGNTPPTAMDLHQQCEFIEKCNSSIEIAIPITKETKAV